MSGFVSGGTLDMPNERSSEWVKAQVELEAERARKAAISQQNDGKSLFEVLQANKAKKQEEFEEGLKLKNQFRSLDDDEVEFLESVLETERIKEQAVKKETTEQIASFRKQQEDVEKRAKVDEMKDEKTEGIEWGVSGGRKRKVEREKLAGVKKRKDDGEKKGEGKVVPEKSVLETKVVDKRPLEGKAAGGTALVAYDSDDD